MLVFLWMMQLWFWKTFTDTWKWDKAEFELPDEGLNLAVHLDNLEKTYVLEALRLTAGNQTKAADLLQMQVRSLRHLLDKHSIRNLSAQMRSGE